SPLPAQTYPDHPIKLIVPSAPGGPTDIPARITAGFIPKLGQPGVVENRPGAGGALGARSVASSPPDGYTLLVGNTSVFAVNPAVSTSAGYDPLKDFAPVAKFSDSFQILVVDPSLRVTSVKELLDYIKANPGKLNYAHTGIGGLPHLTAELFIARTGANIVGVPYRSGGEAVTAVLGQNVQMTFEAISILLPLIREGKVRALAVTSPARTPLAPDLPTMMEAGVPNYEVTTFNGIAAPAGTPAPIIGKLNAAINDGLLTAATKETLAKLGAVASPGSPEDFAAFIAAELAKWRSVAQKANVKID
ncbi:MAG: Bug family tripartite tricarboxylate transporter substrate binding protein, partial [Xanthobacteraceae bacterium]